MSKFRETANLLLRSVDSDCAVMTVCGTFITGVGLYLGLADEGVISSFRAGNIGLGVFESYLSLSALGAAPVTFAFVRRHMGINYRVERARRNLSLA
jgi:hypothetical protein